MQATDIALARHACALTSNCGVVDVDQAPCPRLVGHGGVAKSILSAAKKHAGDLIVMASQGRKGILRVPLASETLDVLTHSHIPGLVLR